MNPEGEAIIVDSGPHDYLTIIELVLVVVAEVN